MISVTLLPFKAEGFVINTEVGLKILWLDQHILHSTSQKIIDKITVERINDFQLEDSYQRVEFRGADFLKDRNTITIANDSSIGFSPETKIISRKVELSLLIEPFYRCYGFENLKLHTECFGTYISYEFKENECL